MVLHPVLRGTIGGLAVLLLLWLGWEGLSGGVDQWSDATTVGQRVQYVTQIAYGVFAVLALLTAFRWKQFRRFADVGFVITSSAAGGLAVVVWGGKSTLSGVATAIASAAVAALILWMLHIGIRSPKSEISSQKSAIRNLP
jgi:hypothetical protein